MPKDAKNKRPNQSNQTPVQPLWKHPLDPVAIIRFYKVHGHFVDILHVEKLERLESTTAPTPLLPATNRHHPQWNWEMVVNCQMDVYRLGLVTNGQVFDEFFRGHWDILFLSIPTLSEKGPKVYTQFPQNHVLTLNNSSSWEYSKTKIAHRHLLGIIVSPIRRRVLQPW